MQTNNDNDKKTVSIVSASACHSSKKNNESCKKSNLYINLPVLLHREQVMIINQLFLKYDAENPEMNTILKFMNHTDIAQTDQYIKMYLSLISKKSTGYKQQDVCNTIYDERWFISTSELLELLVSSKLLCYYCKGACYIHYTEAHSGNQWTLDRISNDHGHNRNNVVISCLSCNLKRGTKSSDRFKLGKQIRFIKI